MGWNDWEPRSAYTDIGGDSVRTEYKLRSDVAAASGRCAWLAADNRTAAVHQWIVKQIRLTGESFKVRLTWETGPVGGLESMKVAIGAISNEPPNKHEDFMLHGVIGERHPPESPTMKTSTLEKTFTSPHPFDVSFAAGYWHQMEIWGGVCIDNIRIDIERLDR